jgi:DNA-binding MarR family transcriptional regulator
MTEFTPPPPDTVAVWTRLMRASAHVLADIESTLKAAGFPPLTWYDALWEIERSAPQGIRPYQLEDRLLLPQYGLSRLVNRMVREGLVERRGVDGDGRGQILHLTDRGATLRRAMWPVYAAALKACISQKLDGDEAPELARLLARLYPPRRSS